MKKTFSLLILIFLSFLMPFLFFHTNIAASKSLECRKFLSSTNTDSIVFYNGQSNFDNDFYYLNKTCSIYCKTEKLPLDILMLKNEVNYTFFDNLGLKENEVLISKNVSQKYSINIGDKLINKSALLSEDSYCIVKDYLDLSCSISVDYFSENTGLIIFGNNDFATKDGFDSVAFLRNSEKLNAVNINKIISIKDICQDLKSYSVRAFLFNLLTQAVLSAAIIFCLYIRDFPLIRKDVVLGFKERELLKRYLLSYFLFSASSTVTYLLSLYFLLLFNHLHYFDFMNLFSLLIPVAIAIIQFAIVKLKIRSV